MGGRRCGAHGVHALPSRLGEAALPQSSHAELEEEDVAVADEVVAAFDAVVAGLAGVMAPGIREVYQAGTCSRPGVKGIEKQAWGTPLTPNDAGGEPAEPSRQTGAGASRRRAWSTVRERRRQTHCRSTPTSFLRLYYPN